ncbi:MAG: class I SAM-dependent methyltransferase [Eubacterium sp.]|nr:class I SAM-dependent methyltransferase [Eubacterium sp.]
MLTDFSEGMIQTAHSNIGDFPNVTYRVVDIQEIPYEMNSFDIVIANMMLYHVPDLAKGLSEVKRVLKESGRFYCATLLFKMESKYFFNISRP